ncbi:MAG: hypothetical protein M1497_09950 [Nitrospirae bacterium]|nr:hypothetical protein [Nitrospirota bacterium]
MKRSSGPEVRKRASSPGSGGKVALLWDESFLWGLMAVRALEVARLPFRLVRSGDLKNGGLQGMRTLFVPGGWASNKLKSLGEEGIGEIKRFISGGGDYLGFCGGAGLATLDGIGLLGIKRRPTGERVPSFSGRIRLRTTDHALWRGITESVFHAWWPSQFLVEEGSMNVIASYGEALPDSFSSDLNVGDVGKYGNWEDLERLYRINLDPGWLLNEPAVVEGRYGGGRVVLSLVHFDTPGDAEGATVLVNLWEYLAGGRPVSAKGMGRREKGNIATAGTSHLVSELFDRCSELISLGLRNFLWFWRNPMLLQWRRGVRGLEYCTLYVMMREIAGLMESVPRPSKDGAEAGETLSFIREKTSRIEELMAPFAEKAKQLLVLERQAMQAGHITYEKCDDPEIREIRNVLFSNAKSHGGLFKELIDEVDALLYSLLSGGPEK